MKANIALEGDAFEATLKAAQVPEELHDGLWDIWTKNTARATTLARRLAPPPSVTVKAAAPMSATFKQAVAALGLPADWMPAEKVAALRDLLGEESALIALRAAQGATTKAARPAPGLSDLLDGAADAIQQMPAYG